MTSSVAGLIDSIAPPRAVIVGVPIACLLGFYQVYTGIHASPWSFPSLFLTKSEHVIPSEARDLIWGRRLTAARTCSRTVGRRANRRAGSNWGRGGGEACSRTACRRRC